MRRAPDCRASRWRAALFSATGCCPDKSENRRIHYAGRETTRKLDPEGDTRTEPGEEGKRRGASEGRRHQQYRPGIRRRRLTEQRPAQNVNGREKRVQLRPPGIGTKRLDWPHYRGYKEYDLHDTGNDRRHITKTRADHTEQYGDPDAGDRDQHKARKQLYQSQPSNWVRIHQQNDRDDHEIMRERQQIAVDEAIDVQRERQLHLLNDALYRNKSAAAFCHNSSDQRPKNQTDS